MQLVYKHGLADHPVFQDALHVMFSAMSQFRLGKSSTLFHNVARELGHIVLVNKKEQSTRFIRSAARATKTFLQNLPTIINVLGKEHQRYAMERDNTKALEVEAKMRKLRDPRFLLRIVGLAQVMESYCEVSLEGQYASHLPSQVWTSVLDNRAELEMLGESWVWDHNDLKFTDIEAPEKIVERLLTSSIYRPKLFFKNVMRKGQEMREAGLLDGDSKVCSLFDEDEMVKPLAGEVLMEVPRARRTRRAAAIVTVRNSRSQTRSRAGAGAFLEEEVEEESQSDIVIDDEEQEDYIMEKLRNTDVEEVEEQLMELCKSIVKEWKARMIQSPLAEATCEVLGKVVMVDDPDTYMVQLKNNLESLVRLLPSHLQEKFVISEVLNGYTSYMEIFRELKTEFQVHDIYAMWHKKVIQIDEPDESNVIFSKLFECVQVRSSSEAYCETVGSIMNNHSGKGRHLRPVNFNKEIYLEVNLPPTYLSENLVHEVYNLRNKSYVFKEDISGRLVTGERLTDKDYGSVIKTFRKKQLEKSRLPAVFWT